MKPICTALLSPWAMVVLFLLLPCSSSKAKSPPNILFIAIDDLRPELGCYGAAHVHSPHIDAFAASGRLFKRAYCQQAVCNPSRTSLMTGMRPDTTGVTGNHAHFRSQHPEVVTLPQHFKNCGYHAAAIGKIYHGVFPEGTSKTQWDTMGDPISWSVPAIRFGPRYYYTEAGIAAAKRVYEQVYQPQSSSPDDWTQKLVFGPATEAPDVPDNQLYDGKVADSAVAALRKLSEGDRPFFLAVGFIKPHSPYVAPKKYFAQVTKVALPKSRSLPQHAPEFAGHRSGELRRYTDQPNTGPISEANQLRVRQAYFACVSYIDAQIGRVLAELDRTGLSQNTIVVLWGDHGYHLGEQGLWGKTTNYELDARVPLIIRTPKMPQKGVATSSLVELVDLYPTLAELAGLPIPSHTEGQSFAKVLDSPSHQSKTTALSQYPRPGKLMGYSMRTETHRLTQWIHTPSGTVRATELYDYSRDQVERKNVATEEPNLVSDLSEQLRSAFHLTSAPLDHPTHATPQNATAEPTVTSFEAVQPGPFAKVETPIGLWQAELGRTIVDNRHAKTGRQCLQLTGGEKTSVLLTLDDSVDRSGTLRFWAERWTSRQPFSFRIEKSEGQVWKEIYSGDDKIRVGRAFLNDVRVPLQDPKINHLRITVTSPPNTGVLLDDFRIMTLRPQQVVRVEAIPFTLPALVGSTASPLFKLKIVTSGSLNPLSLTEVSARLESTLNETPIRSVAIAEDLANAAKAQTSISAAAWQEDKSLNIPASLPLSDGENVVWLTGELHADANIDGRIRVSVPRIQLGDQTFPVIQSAPAPMQRLGVAVRQAGEDNVHTFRIPGLVTTNAGTLIGVYDTRYRNGRDLPGDIDVGMSRSTDGGRTWEPMRIIMDMGNDAGWSYEGIGDPAILVDQQTGTIWVAATWSHGNRSWRGSGPGLKPTETGQLMLVRSDDDGKTWSKPINITEQVKKPEWCFLLQGPGKGITMRDGTLVFAAQYQDPPAAKRLPHSTIIYSNDHGNTWQVGTGAFDDTTESQVVELEPGRLMLNCRYNRESTRVVMTTRDLGKTWQKHSSSQLSLIEPRACMASLINVDQELGQDVGGWLLFSNPNSTRSRQRLTIKSSPDLGTTWPKQFRLLLDENPSAGYSCMSMIDAKTVGILYEGSQAHMVFQRIPLSDIIGTSNEENVSNNPPEPAQPKQLHSTGSSSSGSDQAHAAEASSKNATTLEMPAVFGDHMVLQADAPIPIWGKARPHQSISIRLGDQSKDTTADRNGRWQVRFPEHSPSAKPIRMKVVSSGQTLEFNETLEFNDILIGEVWVCAGQSNMEWMLRQSTHGQEELDRLAKAAHAGDKNSPDSLPIRLLHLQAAARGNSGSYSAEQLAKLTPGNFCQGAWEVASPDSAASFSAVAWYFGRDLQTRLGVPVGLVCPAVGGTPTEAWIPRKALAADSNLRGMVAGNWLENERLSEFCRSRGRDNLIAAIQAGEVVPGDSLGPNHSFKPGFMWEAGVAPIIPYAIRGVIWYQGESNAENASRVREHESLFPLMVKQWRQAWGQGDFPFLYVQLPAMNRPNWPAFRDSQRRLLGQLNRTGMVVTIDTGHPSNVHPPLKKPVGERLARLALGTTYNAPVQNDFAGPLLREARPRGDAVLLSFEHAQSGLTTNDKKPLRHFELAGHDGLFHPAKASISDSNTIVVSSPQVTAPSRVRYAWSPFLNPPVNLVNEAGLPASPFTATISTLSHSVPANPSIEEAPTSQTVSPAAPSPPRPNIVLIVSEDNSDHLGCYGETRVHTPHLDALAARGVRYTRAYVPYSVCSPSRAAFLTGLYPRQTGHIGLATHRFSMCRDFKTLPAYFQHAGYFTGFLGKTHVNPARTVEDYVDHRAIPQANFAKTISIETYANEAAAVMRQAKEAGKPFFLIINYADAHRQFVGQTKHGYPTQFIRDPVAPFPWIGSDSPEFRQELRDYFNCMNRLDEGIGFVLDKLDEGGFTENTMVVYISDHGADFPRGKGSVYENGTRIPMIVTYPREFTSGRVETGLVSTLDLLPTMLRAADIPTPDNLPGVALQDIVAGAASTRKYIHTFTTGSSPNLLYVQFAIRDERFKLIYSPDRTLNRLAQSRYTNSRLPDDQQVDSFLHPPEFELYDLQSDPFEWNNLADSRQHQVIKDELFDTMRAFQSQIKDPFADPSNLQLFIAEQKRFQTVPYKKPGFRWPHLEMFER